MQGGPEASTWQDAAKVREYVDRVGTLPARITAEAELLDALPLEVRRVLDLGCGDGRLTALVLEAHPELETDDFVLSRQVNLETIHDHDVLAERWGTVGEVRQELEGAAGQQRQTTLAEWLTQT